ncbi:hypothetical protein AX17_001612 [Amanita inopinata Kibby_2008]|nr:hypothetical protein AX17_001612 [Amanita inopinata Kibby_2008]
MRLSVVAVTTALVLAGLNSAAPVTNQDGATQLSRRFSGFHHRMEPDLVNIDARAIKPSKGGDKEHKGGQTPKKKDAKKGHPTKQQGNPQHPSHPGDLQHQSDHSPNHPSGAHGGGQRGWADPARLSLDGKTYLRAPSRKPSKGGDKEHKNGQRPPKNGVVGKGHPTEQQGSAQHPSHPGGLHHQSEHSPNHQSGAHGGGQHGWAPDPARLSIDRETYLRAPSNRPSLKDGGKERKNGQTPKYKEGSPLGPLEHQGSTQHPSHPGGFQQESDHSHNHQSGAHGGGQRGWADPARLSLDGETYLRAPAARLELPLEW